MSLSDCIYCYNTPCTCGYGYRDWSSEHIEKMRAILLKVKMINEMYPELNDEDFIKKIKETE